MNRFIAIIWYQAQTLLNARTKHNSLGLFNSQFFPVTIRYTLYNNIETLLKYFEILISFENE